MSDAGRWQLHPALADAALHAAFLADLDEGSPPLRLPFVWRSVVLHAPGVAPARVEARIDGDTIDLHLFASDGTPVATLSLLVREVTPAALARGQTDPGLLAVAWKRTARSARDSVAPEVVDLTGPDDGAPPPDQARSLCLDFLALARRRLADPAAPKVVIRTRGAVSVAGEPVDPAAASVWGLVRAAQSEHPGQFVLVDHDGTAASDRALLGAVSGEDAQLALRDGVALVARAAALVAPADAGHPQASFDPDRTVLVTGGTGGIGGLLAAHLVRERGIRRILLVSRSGGAPELVADLERDGATVEVARCDVSDRAALVHLLDSIGTDHPLGAVFHCAGVLDDALVESMRPEQLATTFGAKAAAAWSLHELTASLDLSAFVLFSSAAGLIGSPGQANYAAANAFLDGLAQRRRTEGLPATSIAWGLWDIERGMSGELGIAERARLSRLGLAPMTAARGLDLFDAALAATEPLVLAADMDRSALWRQAAAGTLPSLLVGLARAPAQRSEPTQLRAHFSSASGEVRRERALDAVRGHVAAVLGHEAGATVPPDAAFKDLGFDSLAAVELRNRLSAAAGLRLPPTLVFDHPNARALAAHLLDLLDAESEEGAAAQNLLEAEIVRLETRVEAAPPDERERAAIRLRSLLARLEAPTAGAELSAATDEELFALIDRELGDE